jgi:hypothetical protein
MNWFNFGIPRICYAPDAPGATPPGGTPPPPSGGTSPPVAPWGNDVNAVWMVDNKPWYEAFVPEGPARDVMKAKNYANPVVVADAYHNANKMLNLDTRLAVPGADAKPEDVNAYYDKRGRAANPEAYEIKAPDGKAFDPGLVKFAKTLAYDLGLTPKEAQVMAAKYDAFAGTHFAEKANADKAANEAAISALETSWKTKGELEPMKAAGLRAIQGLGLQEATLQKIEGQIGHAAVIELLALVGSKAGEGGSFKSDGGTGGNDNPMASPEAAKAEIDRLGNDAVFQKAYTTKNDPGHIDAVKRMEALYARAGNKAA